MALRKPKTILYRRKREKRTDYKRRRHLLLSGKPRLVVRFTNHRIIAQVVKFAAVGDAHVAAVDSAALLKKHGWKYSYKNTPAAYLTGLAIGKLAVAKGEKEAILDTGFPTPLRKGKQYAFLKGVLDSGLEVPHGGDEIFPDEGRISGEHIAAYAKHLQSSGEYEKRFTEYLKNNVKAEEITAQFEKVKQALVG